MKNISILFVAVLATATAAAAQTATTGFVAINGGYQITKHDFSDGGTFPRNAEDGRLDNTYNVKGGPSFDVAGGARIWRQLGVGVGVSRFTISTPATLTGSIPHPFFFSRPRSVTSAVAGLTRSELAVHIQARGVIPSRGRIQAMVFGGPTWFQVEQDIITSFSYTETYPYDSATFATAVTTSAKKSKIGFHGGADVAFFFTRQLGVGGTIQFSRATMAFPAVNATQNLEVGGVQAGGGVRLRF